MIVLRAQVLLKLHGLTQENYLKMKKFLLQVLFKSSTTQARSSFVNKHTERKFTAKFILKIQSNMSIDMCVFFKVSHGSENLLFNILYLENISFLKLMTVRVNSSTCIKLILRQ
jgi:hypothetical protein